MITSPFELKHLENVYKGVVLFNQQLYWECHEDLEGEWIEARGDNLRNVYWAIIQVAASLVHVDNGNIIGARGLIKKAQEKFLRVQNFNIENEIIDKFLDWKELKKLVFNLGDHSELPDFDELYRFRFKHSFFKKKQE